MHSSMLHNIHKVSGLFFLSLFYPKAIQLKALTVLVLVRSTFTFHFSVKALLELPQIHFEWFWMGLLGQSLWLFGVDLPVLLQS